MESPSQSYRVDSLCEWCRRNVIDTNANIRTRLFELRDNGTVLCRVREPALDYCLCEGVEEEFSTTKDSTNLITLSRSASGCESCQILLNLIEQPPQPSFFRSRLIWGCDVFPKEAVLGFPGYYFRVTCLQPKDDGASDGHSSAVGATTDQVDFTKIGNVQEKLRPVVAFIRSQLDICRTHEKCREHTNYKRPSRLLRLTGNHANPKVRLEKTEAESGTYLYTCLSYCWGGDQQHSTKMCNLEQYENDIPQSKIPRTVLDGIKMTLQIGFSYIWVDAYCIIQDNIEDKNEQISKMADIYKGGVCTFSIASSSSAEEGFLHYAWQISEQHAKVAFEGSHRIILEVSSQLDSQWSREQVIHTRAWTLQESKLSRIVVSFGKALVPVQFRCATEFTGISSFRPSRLPVESRDSHLIASGDDASLNGDNLHREWLSVAMEYSTRQMSRREDKLTAIAAIAADFQDSDLLGKYCAGLWSRYAVLGLLWHAPFTVNTDEPQCGYIAPSWSWASCTKPIHYQIDLQANVTSKVMQCKTLPEFDNNPTGSLRFAFLKISCHAVSRFVPSLPRRDRHVYLDDERISSELDDIWILFLAYLTHGEHFSHAGLLIQEDRTSTGFVNIDSGPRYRRVGMFRNEVPASRQMVGFRSVNFGVEDPETYPIREFTII